MRDGELDHLGRICDEPEEIASGRVRPAATLLPIAHGRRRQPEFSGEAIL